MKEPLTRTIYDNYDLWDQYSEFAKETLSEYEEEPSEDSIWNVINDEDSTNWECEKERLEEFFNDGSTWILRGTNGRWNGTFEAGTIFTDFMDMYREAMTDCDYVHLYDENGHFYMQCSHHDGTNYYEIRKLTDKGIEYLKNWEENWNDKRSERYIYDQIMKRYSTFPNFAHKVYGCPKVEWKKEVA